MPRRRSAEGDRQLQPTSWSGMKTAFEASYLSADTLARSVEKIVTLTQGPNESVTSYVNRHRDGFNNLNRQVERRIRYSLPNRYVWPLNLSVQVVETIAVTVDIQRDGLVRTLSRSHNLLYLPLNRCTFCLSTCRFRLLKRSR